MTIKGKLNQVPRITWWCYKYAAMTVFTGLVMVISLAALNYLTRYVELPNGVRLVPSIFDTGDIALVSPDGETVIDSGVMEFVWNDGYVAGRRRIWDSKPPDGPSSYFLYKVGDDEAKEYFTPSSLDYHKYMKEIEKHGLHFDEEILPRHFNEIMETYWSLVKDNKYRRTLFQ